MPQVVAPSTSTLCELIQIVIYQILYLRNVYPRELFTKTQKYSQPIFTPRHPKLVAYVHEFSKDLEAEINKGRRVDRLMCLVVDERPRTAADHDRQAAWNGKVLERWVFEFGRLPGSSGRAAPSGTAGAFNDFELDALLRSFLLKIYAMDSMLQPPLAFSKAEEGSTFMLVIEEPGGPLDKLAWAPVKPDEIDDPPGTGEIAIQGSYGAGQIVPGKHVDMGDIAFQFYVEENDYKGKGKAR